MFLMKILLILPKFHEETLSCPRDIFVQGGRSTCTLFPPFMDTMLSEGRQLMKWVGIFQVRIFCVETFPVEIFLEP